MLSRPELFDKLLFLTKQYVNNLYYNMKAQERKKKKNGKKQCVGCQKR